MKNSFENNNKAEKEKKYGLNVHAKIEFGRHEVPGKTDTGMSADYLTPEGQDNAIARGILIEEENVAAYGSPKERAQETVDLEVGAAELAVNVVNKRLEDLPEKGKPREGIQKEENEFKIKVKEELDAIPDFAKIMPHAKEWAQKQMDDGVERGMYDLIVQYYLDNSDFCEDNGITTPHEAATQIAYRAAREVGMTEHFLNDTDIRLINITHGPKLEPFLLEVVDEFKTLEDIGDALKPGESFEFQVDIDEEGKKIVKLNLRNKVYDVNTDQLKELATEYREKVLAKRKK